MYRNLLFCLIACLLSLAPAAPILAQSDLPLLMDGKTRLYQRVLVRDRTASFDGPDGAQGDEIAPLQPLYVYERQSDWVRVALGDNGQDQFWLPAENVVDWNQNIVVTFEGSENVGRVLFFSDEDGLYEVIESESPELVANELRSEATNAEKGGPKSDRIVALGPRNTVNQKQNLYVMPILEAQEAIFENGTFVNLLKVAVARADQGRPVPRSNLPKNAPDELRENYKAGIVFVVDTTISMEPYIQGTRAAIEEIYKSVTSQSDQGAISFGLIGYRDNLEAAPGLEYSVKTFVDLQEGFDARNFAEGISQMTEANSSSRNFREDSFAGVEHAINALDWSEINERYIIVVTDAGPRQAGDKYSTTGLNADGMNAIVKERLGAAIAVMHLRTPKGKNDHGSAEAAYRALSNQANGSPLYFPVKGGNPTIYKSEAKILGQLIFDQVASFRRGQEPKDFGGNDTDTGGFASALRSAGRTMQLAFLGKTEGTQAPDVFEAYIADRDFDRTGLKPLSVRLLLNKSDLSDLNEALKIIIEKAEENVIDPAQFFTQVLGAAADMSRRPDEVARRADTTLAEAVAISEYLDGLPYKSRIMKITESDWVNLSISEQITITNELVEKIERYHTFNEATDLWVDYLGTNTGARSLLYPMRLDDLP